MERRGNGNIQMGEQIQLWSPTKSSKLMQRFFMKEMKVLEPIIALMHRGAVLILVLKKIGQIVEEQGART